MAEEFKRVEVVSEVAGSHPHQDLIRLVVVLPFVGFATAAGELLARPVMAEVKLRNPAVKFHQRSFQAPPKSRVVR
jgi:hypothetical protein